MMNMRKNRKRQIVSAVIVVVLIAAMVIPTVAIYLRY